MVTLELRLLAGRYHATPWGHHVNEALVEWPPAPWRLLRSLVSAYLSDPPENAREAGDSVMRRLLVRLTAEYPEFVVPSHVEGHTRHFMPWLKKGPEDRTLVFDSFAAVDPCEPVRIKWIGVDLDGEAMKLLDELLRRVSYLGRAESWCEIRLAAAGCVNGEGKVARPLSEGSPVTPGDETFRLLCLLPAAADAKLDEKHPLLVRTVSLRKERLSPKCPPGGAWIRYARPRESPPAASREERSPSRRNAPTAAVFHLHATVLPRVTDTVEIGELARAALQSRHGRLHDGTASPVFSGKDESGSPLQGHAHAHYLPMDADGDGRIETLVVYAPCGFGPAERKTLTSIRRLRRRGDPYPMTCIMLGLGDRSGLGAVPALSEHRLWRSVTPFLLTRHPKKDGRDQPLDQLRLEIARRGMPEPSIVQYVPWLTVKGRRTRWIEFRRWRRHHPSSPLGIGFGFEIEFEEPVRGPIALGYGSHFGLGLFLPKNRSDA